MNNLSDDEIKEKLEKWPENKLVKPIINPITNRKINIDGPTYKKLEKKYEELFSKNSNNENINTENDISEDFDKKLNIEDNIEEISDQQNILNKLDKELDNLFTEYGLQLKNNFLMEMNDNENID